MRVLDVAVLLGGMLVCLPAQAVEMTIPDALARLIEKCWVQPDITERTTVTMDFKLDKRGAVIDTPQPHTEPLRHSEKVSIEAARRAILKCAPYPLAAGEEIRIHFER